MRTLQDKNDNFSESHISVVFDAVRKGDTVFIEKVISKFPSIVNIRNSSSETLLHIAALSGKFIIFKILLENGSSIDKKDINGRTPLTIAKSLGQPEYLEAILNLVNLTSCNKQGISRTDTNNKIEQVTPVLSPMIACPHCGVMVRHLSKHIN